MRALELLSQTIEPMSRSRLKVQAFLIDTNASQLSRVLHLRRDFAAHLIPHPSGHRQGAVLFGATGTVSADSTATVNPWGSVAATDVSVVLGDAVLQLVELVETIGN